jgi:ankyrin repeat protein
MEQVQELKEAFRRDDAAAVRQALAAHPEWRALVNAPIGPFDSPAVVCARSREMLDVLLDAGADINAKSRWWAGGFGLLDSASDELARYAIERGARVEIHAAARLGMLDRVKELVAYDPALVSARGGDGKTPLHFARNLEIAQFLLENGADINARDIDHESTPAQHLIKDHPDVVRFLVKRGCATDIFLAAALGDLALAEKLLRAEPDYVRWRINAECFPMRNPRAGGTIYQWTLGFNLSPHQVAAKFGHREMLEKLMNASPTEVRLVNACWLSDADLVEKVLAADPDAPGKIMDWDQRAMCDAARENDLRAVELMLKAGLPRDARGQHGATALHWAAWRGNVKIVELLLRAGLASELETHDRDHQATPLGWATHASEHGWDIATGDYSGVVKALLAAGAKKPAKIEGSPAVREALSGAR